VLGASRSSALQGCGDGGGERWWRGELCEPSMTSMKGCSHGGAEASRSSALQGCGGGGGERWWRGELCEPSMKSMKGCLHGGQGRRGAPPSKGVVMVVVSGRGGARSPVRRFEVDSRGYFAASWRRSSCGAGYATRLQTADRVAGGRAGDAQVRGRHGGLFAGAAGWGGCSPSWRLPGCFNSRAEDPSTALPAFRPFRAGSHRTRS